MHQVMSYNDPSWISTYVSRVDSRSNPPDSRGMRIALNAAETASSHGVETIGWVAADADAVSSAAGVPWETYLTPDSVQGHDNGCYAFSYRGSYSSPPIVLGFQQEMDGVNGSWSVTCSDSASEAGFHAEEDQVNDSERWHTTETFGFAAFAGPVSYSDAGNRDVAVTGSRLKVTNLVFTDLSGGNGRKTVGVDFTAEYAGGGSGPVYNYSRSWRTAVGVRK